MPGGPAVLRFSRGLPPTKQFGERLRLLVVQGGDKGTCYSLLGNTVFVGREDCQIVLNDTNISRKHAEFDWKGDHYVIRDLGSANGVLCNGEKVIETKLKAGDLVLIGLTVFEVYPPGQTRKTDKPVLPLSARRTAVAKAGPLSPEAPPHSSQEERVEKSRVQRKRVIIMVVLFFLLATAYFNDQNESMRQHSTLPKSEDEEDPRPKKKLDKSELAKLLAEYTPSYALDTQQRKDAEVFFRNGVRELQNKNFRRAFTAFDTALTVDPSHELAKIYLKSAKMEMLNELDSTSKAATRAMKSLRYKEARMHLENIVRYLDGESAGNASLDQEVNKDLRKLFEEAKASLQELDEKENRPK